MSKRPIQSPPDRHSGAAGLEWGLVQEPVCISIPLPAGSVRHCPSPNFNLRPQGDAVSLLVIHNISLPPGQFGTGKVQAFFQNRLDPNEHPYFEEIRHLTVSAHFLIERDGAITQFVSCHDRAWHAGVSCFDGREACNDFSLGIELEGTDTEPYTDAQYTALAGLTRLLRAAFPAITPERIQGHCDIAPERKTDPGEAFDWSRYRAGLTDSKEET
ncbi:1,6-anhydro-N-acetylmuramyl-L-alanine amidase AmpD [Pseudomonas aeruginosa]|nr:1,6-anhydro-N-acetylmuramyl-L-alanine amidase AmpD [Pseudomonas aeruginosa]